jgi:hypothetical protein
LAFGLLLACCWGGSPTRIGPLPCPSYFFCTSNVHIHYLIHVTHLRILATQVKTFCCNNKPQDPCCRRPPPLQLSCCSSLNMNQCCLNSLNSLNNPYCNHCVSFLVVLDQPLTCILGIYNVPLNVCCQSSG